ncbi:CC157 protein, partial [Centropus bengalensis]|nr:CC157 protein [Centropus bengalensis]
RLLLLLQSFTAYAENVLSERAVPPARAVGPCMSAGLTARRYWCSMLKLGASHQQLLAEQMGRESSAATLLQPPGTSLLPREALPALLTPGLHWCPLPSPPPWSSPNPSCPSLSLQPRAAHGTARSTRSTSTQTSGLSPRSCDTCPSAQASLRALGTAITSICQSHNIPSALSRFQDTVEETTGRTILSATDMSYWAAEQSKDLSRISKHLQMLLQQVHPLRLELEESAKQREELQKQVEDFPRLLQVEKENQAQQRKEAQQNLEAKHREYLEAVARLEQDKDDLRRGMVLLCQRCCVSPEVTKKSLLEEMRTAMVATSQVQELEDKVQQLTSQLQSLSQELGGTTTQLEKEKAKVESLLRHQESLQAKHRTLLQQLDSLDQEHEELQASLGEAEQEKARLMEQLEESRVQHRKQLQAQQKREQELKEQARELKERERLLVFFPELHITAEAQFESTGNLTEDMEKQLQANSIRIRVLEQENVQLRSALTKVKVAAEQGVLK